MTKKRNIWSCDEAVAAIELALLLPVFMIVLLGSVTVYDTYKAQGLAIDASGTMAELIARDDVVTLTDVNNALGAGQVMVAPFGDNVHVRVGYVEYIDNKPKVVWSRSRNGNRFTSWHMSRIKFPPMVNYDSIVIAEVSFKYKPVFTILGAEEGVISHLAMRKPVFVEFLNTRF